MKYNVLNYFLSEGFKNLFKNKKSTFSCLGVMCVAMLMFGFFFAVGQNITHMVNNIEDAQAIRVFILQEATEEEIEVLKNQINKIDGINSMTFVTQEEAYNEVKEGLEERKDVMEGIYPEAFSSSFVITLTDLELAEQIEEQILKLDNVKKITSNNDTINALSKIAKWIRIVTGSTLIVLIIMSVFIIANTIKLTVHARRKEISIMKYVGATNGFIRAPFIIEGIIIGLIASIISIVLIGGGYTLIVEKLVQDPTVQKIGLPILEFRNLYKEIVIVYAVLGVGIGVIGSSISMRKYLEV